MAPGSCPELFGPLTPSAHLGKRVLHTKSPLEPRNHNKTFDSFTSSVTLPENGAPEFWRVLHALYSKRKFFFIKKFNLFFTYARPTNPRIDVEDKSACEECRTVFMMDFPPKFLGISLDQPAAYFEDSAVCSSFGCLSSFLNSPPKAANGILKFEVWKIFQWPLLHARKPNL